MEDTCEQTEVPLGGTVAYSWQEKPSLFKPTAGQWGWGQLHIAVGGG